MDNNNSHGESNAKTDALFTESTSDGTQQGKNGGQKNSKGALVLHIFSLACAAIGVSAVVAIFTGRLHIPGNSEVIYLERGEAIVAAAVCIGFAFLLSFFGRWVATAAKRADIAVAKAVEVPVEQYKSIHKKYKIFRITHYIILGTLLVSPVVTAIAGESIAGDIFIGVFMLALVAFIPILILLLINKHKLKKIKVSQSLPSHEEDVNG